MNTAADEYFPYSSRHNCNERLIVWDISIVEICTSLYDIFTVYSLFSKGKLMT